MSARITQDQWGDSLLIEKQKEGSLLESLRDFLSPEMEHPEDWLSLHVAPSGLTISSMPAGRQTKIARDSLAELHFLIEPRLAWIHPIRCSFDLQGGSRLSLHLRVEGVDTHQKAQGVIFRIARILGRARYEEHQRDSNFVWLSLPISKEAPQVSALTDDPYRDAGRVAVSHTSLPLPTTPIALEPPEPRAQFTPLPPGRIGDGFQVLSWSSAEIHLQMRNKMEYRFTLASQEMHFSYQEQRAPFSKLDPIRIERSLTSRTVDKQKSPKFSLSLIHFFNSGLVFSGGHLPESHETFRELYPLASALSQALDLSWQTNLFDRESVVVSTALKDGFALATGLSLVVHSKNEVRCFELPFPAKHFCMLQDGSFWVLCSGYLAGRSESALLSWSAIKGLATEWKGRIRLDSFAALVDGSFVALGADWLFVSRQGRGAEAKKRPFGANIPSELRDILATNNVVRPRFALSHHNTLFMADAKGNLLSTSDLGATWKIKALPEPRSLSWLSDGRPCAACSDRVVMLDADEDIRSSSLRDLVGVFSLNGRDYVFAYHSARMASVGLIDEGIIHPLSGDQSIQPLLAGVRPHANSKFIEGIPEESQGMFFTPINMSEPGYSRPDKSCQLFFSDGGVYAVKSRHIYYAPLWSLLRE
jgi:hypothetical protein